MNCMSKKVLRRKEQIAEERRKAEEDEYFNSLSEDERIAYRKNIEERRNLALRYLSAITAITSSTFYFGKYSR